MSSRSTRKTVRNRRIINSIRVESLECRQLLTVSADTIIKPLLDISPAAAGSSVGGYTPAQIRSVYGFDKASFSGVTGDGSGQTIAIVAAFNDPNISSDLHTFDTKFGLTDPSFSQVSQTGGSTKSLATDAGWSGEISLDVEWAHAIAPKAKILLVEASNDSLGNLMTAVNYARNATDVSVVSMSWGGSEFWGETSYDSYFTTPAGHQGVTFVAASGDSGSWYGPSWPASSPNVLAVGGTSLSLQSASGGYGGETGWQDSGGGISNFENEPAYQANAQTTGGRTTPDVSFDANPNTGFAVYDSVPYQGQSGWSVIGGTSAGAPQWAALIAIANQGRAINHLGTLDGTTGTLPMLYSLYNNPTAYAANFNDVTQGRTSFRLGAHTGYDGVAGLGTPKVSQLVLTLSGSTPKAAAPASPPPSSNSNTSANAKVGRIRRNRQVAPPPDVTSVQVVAVNNIPFAPAPIITLSLAGNHGIFGSSLGTSAAALSGGFAAPGTIFTTVFFGRSSASILSGMFSHRQVERLPQVVASAGESASAIVAGAMPSTDQTSIAPVIPEIAATVAPRIFQFARIDWFNAFSDAWSALAQESASTIVLASAKKVRAWTITAAVATMDAVLLAYWYARKRKSKQATGVQLAHTPENLRP